MNPNDRLIRSNASLMRLRAAAVCLSVIIALTTMYALSHPAITMSGSNSVLSGQEGSGPVQEVQFDTDTFSPYVMVYTVDVQKLMQDIPGNSTVTLSSLLDVIRYELKYPVTVDEVTDVWYTGDLASVSETISMTEHDWNIRIFPDEDTRSLYEAGYYDAVRDPYAGSEEERFRDEYLTVSLADGSSVKIAFAITGIPELQLGDTVIRSADGTYLPDDAEGYSYEVVDEEAVQAAAAAVEAAEAPSPEQYSEYSVYDIGLNLHEETAGTLIAGDSGQAFETLQVDVTLQEECQGSDFRLYQVAGSEVKEIASPEWKETEQGVNGFSFTADARELQEGTVQYVLQSVLKKDILASDGRNYRISVTYGPEAGVPENADLEVEEILPAENLEDGEYDAYQEYASLVRDTLGWENGSASYFRLFDIRIVDANGEKVEIAAPVDVKIELADKEASEEAADNTQLVHFADGAEEGDVIDSLEIDGNAISFEAEGFSAYAIVEGPPAVPLGWHKVTSIDDLISMGSKGVYIGHPDGYYYGNTLVKDKNRTGIAKTKPAQTAPDRNTASRYYFEQAEGTDGKVYACCYAPDGTTKQYVYNGGNNSLSFAADPSGRTAFTLAQNGNGAFTLSNGAWYWNMQGGASGARFCCYNSAGDVNNSVYFWYYDEVEEDPYDLDGTSYGLISWTGGVAGKALMAESAGEHVLAAKALPVMSTVNNSSQLFVPNDSDISMWTFHWAEEDAYYMSAVADGSTKYLKIDESGLSLVSGKEEASPVRVVPGTEAHAGEFCLESGGTLLTFSGTTEDGFSAGGNADSGWLNFAELSELTTDYFLTYSAGKVSVSDGNITNGSRVIVYTRSWNTEKLKYDYYAIASDGTLVPVYESGDNIEWISGQLNTLLWNFVEYYWEDTSEPNYYYELYNQYSEKFIAPQITGSQILSDEGIGINLNGRRDGQYYSSILAWDEAEYSYAGLRVQDGEIVTCPKSEAMDFYFAVMQDLNVDDTLHPVRTLDHTQYGITMKIRDFSDRAMMSNFLGNNEGGATLKLQQGLLSTDLTDGYPAASGGSLGSLFSGSQEVNHLFMQSTYEETGYFEYDSAQNFATLKGAKGGDFTVYKELGTYDSSGGRSTLKHGEFFPFNDLKPGVFTSINGENLYAATGGLLSDGDPRKYEKLYSVEHDGAKPNFQFGLELEASFSQTVSGLDAWGHDIIFEFTGDDDFWLYVDGELVIDLGGIHSAVPGSVNFRTGDVMVNGTHTTLRALFESNYRKRNPGASDEAAAEFLSRHFDEGSTVFRDNTNHTMNIFYMERGAGASNLHMRFNLAAVRKGTVQLTKTLSGVDEGDIMAEFPYQILYRTSEQEGAPEYRLTNEIAHSAAQNMDYVYYKDTITPVRYLQSAVIDGVTYQDVFFLKPGETADIGFPAGMTSYRIVECGVNTDIYSSVTVNEEVISGTPVSGSSSREDFGIGYASTDDRPKVNYVNAVNPDALRKLTIRKMLFREDGITPVSYSEDGTEFIFRVYLSSEFDDPDMAGMHTYHVKDPDGYYCCWDAASQKFAVIGEGIRDWQDLTDAQKTAAGFTTSIYGSVSKIPAGFTVEIRNVLAGTQYRVEELPREIPDGYSFQKYEYDEDNARLEKNASGVTGVNGTVVSGEDAPVVVCNLKGWGLRMNKVWRDRDYMSSRDAAYFALFTKDADGNLVLTEDSVRRLPYSAKQQSIYWYYEHLPVAGTTGVGDYYIREVTVSPADPPADSDGIVTGFDTAVPVEDGNQISLGGTQKGEETASQFTYTVQYAEGEITSDSNVRVDTVTNDRPGVILKKQDWDGNPLAGAAFTLRDGENQIGAFISDQDGLITTAFLTADKEYTLTETGTPQTYRGLETPLTIRVNADGTVEASGAEEGYYTLTQAQGSTLATLTVKNRSRSFRAVKTDGDTQEPMKGVKFALHRQKTVDGVTTIDLNPMPGFEELVTDEDGVIPKLDNSLPAGTYELREKETLAGYEVLTDYIRFTVSPTGSVALGTHPDGITLTGEPDESGVMEYVMTVPNSQRKKVSFRKVDIARPGDSQLAGAVFDLYAVSTENGEETRQTTALYTGLVSGEDGMLEYKAEKDAEAVTVFELQPGKYHLVETEAPAGYMIKQDPVEVIVTGSDVAYDEGTNLSGDGSGKTHDAETNVFTLKISNTSGYELPATGGPGTRHMTAAGLLLLALAAALGIRRRLR